MYLPDTTLSAWDGAAMYLVDPATDATEPLTVQPSGRPFALYEVSVVEGRGSWWLPTVPTAQVPSGWYASTFGGVEALAAQGTGIPTTIAGAAVMRPSQALWWIPVDTLGRNEIVVPGDNRGQVQGAFPTLEPAPSPGPSPTPHPGSVEIEQLDPTHTRVTVHPGDTPIRIEIWTRS